jgi:superfamily II DNA/RNA helicase
VQIVDEVDRLLRQDYQGWLAAVNEATEACRNRGFRALKIAVSATLTRDPAKLSKLQLHAPRCGTPQAHRRPGGKNLSNAC